MNRSISNVAGAFDPNARCIEANSVRSCIGADILGRPQSARGFFRAVVSAFAIAAMVFAVGCSPAEDDEEGGGGGGGNPEVIGDGGVKLSGDYTFNAEYVNERGFISFKPNGQFCQSYYQKVDNFWVGGEACNGTWSADDNRLYMIYNDSEYDRETLDYRLSGNTLTVFGCEYYDGEMDCWEDVLTRGSNKPSGTVRSGDPGLMRTDWRMGSSYLELYNPWMWMSWDARERYFTGNDYYDYLWYTEGNRLYMLGVEETDCRPIWCNNCQEFHYDDCAYTIVEQVDVSYTLVPRTSLLLRNDSRGINDTWRYYGYDGGDDDPYIPPTTGGDIVNGTNDAWIECEFDDYYGEEYCSGFMLRNGKFYSVYYDDYDSVWYSFELGTYTINGNAISINLLGEIINGTYSVSGNTLTLTLLFDGIPDTYIYTKRTGLSIIDASGLYKRRNGEAVSPSDIFRSKSRLTPSSISGGNDSSPAPALSKSKRNADKADKKRTSPFRPHSRRK